MTKPYGIGMFHSLRQISIASRRWCVKLTLRTEQSCSYRNSSDEGVCGEYEAIEDDSEDERDVPKSESFVVSQWWASKRVDNEPQNGGQKARESLLD